MIQLSIDTCNTLCAVALSTMESDQLTIIDSNTLDLGRGHAEVLTQQISDILKANDLQPADLSRIAVTTGPGSFTGQRVGLTMARSLASALKLELIGIGVLDALIEEAGRNAGSATTICAIGDAKREAVYLKAVSTSSGPQIAESLVTLSDLPAALASLDKPLSLVGSGQHLVPLDDSQIRIDLAFPSIATIAQLGHTLSADDHPAVPLYLRDADAKPQSAKHVLRQASSVAKGQAVSSEEAPA